MYLNRPIYRSQPSSFIILGLLGDQLGGAISAIVGSLWELEGIISLLRLPLADVINAGNGVFLMGLDGTGPLCCRPIVSLKR